MKLIKFMLTVSIFFVSCSGLVTVYTKQQESVSDILLDIFGISIQSTYLFPVALVTVLIIVAAVLAIQIIEWIIHVAMQIDFTNGFIFNTPSLSYRKKSNHGLKQHKHGGHNHHRKHHHVNRKSN